MTQARCNLNLATETIGTECHPDVVVQNLDRDHPSVLDVTREEDGSHASLPELALDIVPIL